MGVLAKMNFVLGGFFPFQDFSRSCSMLTRRDETRQADRQTLLLNKGSFHSFYSPLFLPSFPGSPSIHSLQMPSIQPCNPNQAKASYPTNHPINQANRAIPFRWGFTKYGLSEL
jgi:hypothetical protein